jgi:hypothetical protein
MFEAYAVVCGMPHRRETAAKSCPQEPAGAITQRAQRKRPNLEGSALLFVEIRLKTYQ